MIFNKKSKKTVFIHIGFHKTGTTAIQDFLNLNVDDFMKLGIYIPDDYSMEKGKGNINHHEIAYALGFSNNLSKNPVDISKFENILKTFRSSNAHSMILSSEVFNENPNDESINLLYNLLEKFTTKIIVYLRRQDQMMQAVFLQNVKAGKVKEKFRENYSNYKYNYWEVLEKWASFFGRSNLIVRTYEKTRFVKNDLFEDFFSITGVNSLDGLKFLERNANPRLSRPCLEYKRISNAIFDDVEDLRVLMNELLAYSIITDDSVENTFSQTQLMSKSTQQIVLEKYKECNDKIKNNYLKDSEHSLFTYDLDGFENEGINNDLNTEEAYLITEFLFENKKNLVEKLIRELEKPRMLQDSILFHAVRFFRPVINEVTGYEFYQGIKSDVEKMELSNKDIAKDILKKRCVVFVSKGNFLNQIITEGTDVCCSPSTGANEFSIDIKGEKSSFKLRKFYSGASERFFINVEIIVHKVDTDLTLFYETENPSSGIERKEILKQLVKGNNSIYFFLDDKFFNGNIEFSFGTNDGSFIINKIDIRDDGLSYPQLFNENRKLKEKINKISVLLNSDNYQ